MQSASNLVRGLRCEGVNNMLMNKRGGRDERGYNKKLVEFFCISFRFMMLATLLAVPAPFRL